MIPVCAMWSNVVTKPLFENNLNVFSLQSFHMFSLKKRQNHLNWTGGAVLSTFMILEYTSVLISQKVLECIQVPIEYMLVTITYRVSQENQDNPENQDYPESLENKYSQATLHNPVYTTTLLLLFQLDFCHVCSIHMVYVFILFFFSQTLNI